MNSATLNPPSAHSSIDGPLGGALEKASPIKKSKAPPDLLRLQVMGDLVLPSCTKNDFQGFYEKFERLFELLANTEKKERLLIYKFLNAIMLTSCAKRCQQIEERKRLFDWKNQLFLSIANDMSLRSKLSFHYLMSSIPYVSKYCSTCQSCNQEANLPKSKQQHCAACEVKPHFFDLLAMQLKTNKFSGYLFINYDSIPSIQPFQINSRKRLGAIKEKISFSKYCYDVQSLKSIDTASVINMYKKLI